MEIEKLHQLINEKKWILVHRELDLKISKSQNSKNEDDFLIQIFEKMACDYRDQCTINLYLAMWKIAFRSGKIRLAKNYVETILNHLIEYKRVPALKKLITELSEVGLLREHKKFEMLNVILGNNKAHHLEDFSYFENHPEMWKNSKNILKSYLVELSSWSTNDWKLAYEYVLKYYYDKDFFINLAERAVLLRKSKHADNFLSFLREKKVNLKAFEVKSLPIEKTKENLLKIDYDQLAMDVISGVKSPSITEQKRVLASIKNLEEDELLEKGKEMIVAFGLLGMDKVVVYLCERVLPITEEAKQRISLQFMLAQAYYNSEEFHKACDVIDDTFVTEPLLADEIIAFNYIKAESLLKLKKHKRATELFLTISKYNPHYRLVGERLREIEENK